MVEGSSQHADFDFGELPDAEFAYWVFASRFGWTPEQVDAIPSRTSDWLLTIERNFGKGSGENRRDDPDE